MDHQDIREQLEIAAVEPGGLDRLMAGDTVAAAAVVAHLAGCPNCSEEFRRLSMAAPLLRDVVRTTPSPDLRDRTLSFVRTHGVRRDPVQETVAPAPVDRVPVTAPSFGGSRFGRILPWAATIAAVIAIAVSGLSYVSNRDLSARLGAQDAAIGGLEAVNRATIELTGASDARRVELVSTTVSETTGTLLFSPSTTRLVVVAYDLARPPAGQEYRCWVEVGGHRQNVGRMFFAQDLAYWVGQTPGVGDLPAGTTFGVSLADVGGASLQADPVISGTL
jgi:hypothetical protein